MTDSAWKSGIRRGTPTWPIRISVWTEPGRWRTRTNRSRTALSATIEPRRRRPRTRRPSQPSSRSAIAADVDPARGRRRRSSVARAGSRPRWYAARRRPASRPLDRLLRPAGRPAVRRARRVDRRGERLVGAAARIGLGLEQVVEPLVAEALDLGLGERRVEGDLGEELERRLEAGGRHVDADRSSRPSRPRRGATRRAARWPRPGRSRRSARCPRSAPGRRGPWRPPSASGSSAAPLRRTSVAETSGRPGQVGDDERTARWRAGSARPPGSRTAAACRASAARRRRETSRHAATSSSSAASASVASARRRRRPPCRPAAARAGRSGRPGCRAGRRRVATCADLLGRDRQVARQHPVDQVRVVEQGRVHREAVGPLLDPREAAELLGLDQRPGAGQLVVGDRLAAEPLELLVERGLDPLDRDAGPDGRPAGADRRAADEPERDERDVLGDPLVADEPAMEPRALAAGEDLGGDVERVEPRVAERRRAEPDVDARQRDAIVDGLAALAAERRRQRQVAERRDRRVGRDAAEVALGPAPDRRPGRRRRRPTGPRCSARSRSGRTR